MKLKKDTRRPAELMEKYLLSLPGQIRHGFELGTGCSFPASYKKVKNVIFCGVGGSAIGGDIIGELMNAESPVPFSVNRISCLPAWVGKDTLAIFSSYSGNTAETQAAFHAAEETGAKMFVLTSGGSLLEKAKARRIPHLVIPGNIPPRCAIGYLTVSLLPVLAAEKWISFPRSQMEKICSAVSLPPKKEAQKIARLLKGKNVFLYANDQYFSPVVKRWRAQLAENAKTIASYHLFPEMLHNEIEGWKFPSGFPKKSVAVFIQDPGCSPKIKSKLTAARNLIRSQGATVIEVDAPSGSLLSRIFSLASLGDWVSYELAKIIGVDPVGIPNIENIKNNY